MLYKKKSFKEIQQDNEEKVSLFLVEKQERLLNLLEEFNQKNPKLPIWESPVFQRHFMNPVSGTVYGLENSIILSMLNYDKGYKYPLYISAKQGYDNGLSNKGEKSSFIVHHFPIKVTIKKKEDQLVNGEDDTFSYFKRCSKLKSMFNLEQFTGEYPAKIKKVIESYEKKPEASDEKVELIIQALMESMPTKLIRHNLSNNYYLPKSDEIHLSERDLFKSNLQELSTLAHEVAHSYGHSSRLNRKSLALYGEDVKYRAEEELVANLAAQSFINYFGLNTKEYKDEALSSFERNHDTYDVGWGFRLYKEHPEKIFESVALADRVVTKMKFEVEKILVAKYLDNLESAPLSDFIKERLSLSHVDSEDNENDNIFENENKAKTKKTMKM